MTKEQFKQARLDAGLTQAELAKELDIHKDTVSKHERGILPVSTVLAYAMETIRRKYESQ